MSELEGWSVIITQRLTGFHLNIAIFIFNNLGGPRSSNSIGGLSGKVAMYAFTS